MTAWSCKRGIRLQNQNKKKTKPDIQSKVGTQKKRNLFSTRQSVSEWRKLYYFAQNIQKER